MPRHPHTSTALLSARDGVFSRLGPRIAQLQGEIYPLHIGDSWLAPPPGCAVGDLPTTPDLHRYTRPHGHDALLGAIADSLVVPPERLLVTTGATGALDALAGTLLDPGDEVILCAPFWPLIRGIVTSHRGVAIEADVMLDPAPPAAAIEALVTERTVAVYVNSPHNPTGRVLPEEHLRGIAEVARRHDLWVWSDCVYASHSFGPAVVPMRDLAPERTFEAHSFSKVWAMAGYRCGFVVGPEDPEPMARVRATSTHTYYSAPTPSQLAAARALREGQEWLADSLAHYRAAGFAAAERLGVAPPEGGTFLFVDVAEGLDEGGLEGFLHRCIDRNLVLAPGTACGTAYDHHVRVCFTCSPPDVTARGVDVLAELLGR